MGNYYQKSLNEESINELVVINEELDKISLNNTDGIIIRSRIKEYEENLKKTQNMS